MPLLSATERIIREAEAAEARRSAADERPAEGSVLPAWSQPTPAPAGPLPEANTEPKAVSMFADGYPEYDDLSDGITRVDLNRSALALEKLRAFDAQPPSGGIRNAGLTTGGQPSPAAPQRALPLIGAVTATPELPGVPRRGPPPGRPTRLADAPSPELPALTRPSAALPESAAPTAEPLVVAHRSRSLSLRHPPRVGRRAGLVIAAATAAAVAPLIGSWTARFENAASARGGAEASPVNATAPSVTSIPAPQAITTVVVPAAAPDPGPGSPSPARPPTLLLEPPGKAPASSSAAERGAPSDAGAKARLLAAVEPRPAQRSSGGKKSRHRAHQTKVTTAAAQPAAATRAAGPSPGSARRDLRSSGDPDDTLPIAIE